MRGIRAAVLVIGDPVANPVTQGVEVRGFRTLAEKSDAGLVFSRPGRSLEGTTFFTTPQQNGG